MFSDVETFVNYVDTQVTSLNYTADNDYDEILDFPAFVVSNDYRKDFDRITSSGQVYHTITKLHFYIFAEISLSKANFNTLVDQCIAAMTAYASLGFEHITLVNVRQWMVQVNVTKCRGCEGDIELRKKENF